MGRHLFYYYVALVPLELAGFTNIGVDFSPGQWYKTSPVVVFADSCRGSSVGRATD